MSKRLAKILHHAGFHVEDGKVYNDRSKEVVVRPDSTGYASIAAPKKFGKARASWSFQVHKLVAYAKYGDLYLKPGIIARHRNHDKMDFSYDNILVGTLQDNSNDQYYDALHEKALAKAKKDKLKSKLKSKPRPVWNNKATGLLKDPNDLSNYY